MKAILRERYGTVRLGELEKPYVPDDGVLVRVHASSLNAVDWYDVMGRPYFSRLMGIGILKPKDPQVGSDFAGTVEAVGPRVTLLAAVASKSSTVSVPAYWAGRSTPAKPTPVIAPSTMSRARVNPVRQFPEESRYSPVSPR